MKKIPFVLLLFVLAGCSTVPVSNRSQLNLVGSLIPKQQFHQMAESQYRAMLKEEKESSDPAQRAMVQRVGNRIAKAVSDYFAMKGMEDPSKDYQWEFRVIDSPQANAFAMPGGKVAVYTGILPITQTEEGLAVVMGHEIAHAIADHGGERMTQQLLAQAGGMALAFTLEAKDVDNRALWVTAYNMGAQLGMLPYSRSHESEADYIGLIFMSMAGYNPEAAIPFWQRMKAAGGATPPEFLSSHPSNETRIKQIEQWLPEAELYYRKAK